jgi:signal peptidase complex subunit 2
LASNVKILYGTIAVAAAFYSHFNGQEFPDNRNLIMLCVAVYGVCMALISAVSYLYEGDSFYSAHLSDVAELMAGQALAPCVWVHSALGEKGSSTYTLTLRRGVRKSPALSAVLAKPYEQFYCEDGQLAVAELQSDLSRLLIKLGKLGPTEKSK